MILRTTLFRLLCLDLIPNEQKNNAKQNFITRDDIIAYAEEGGDFAQLKEVDSFMEVRPAVTSMDSVSKRSISI